MLEESDKIALIESKSIDISSCETLCLALGPYRNLTTLTAATLFLHPDCQVLNHAGSRIFGNPEVDFISDFSRERVDRFIQFAIKISVEGKKGDFGGSITLSHAFDPKHNMKEIHQKSGLGVLKENVKSLFWKESLKTSILLRRHNVDLSDMFEKDERLRFLMPIRNPFDCAMSNIKTGQASLLLAPNSQPSLIDVLHAILYEIHWFSGLQKRYPERFFSYFENEISSDMLIGLAGFLKLDPSESWVDDAISAMKLRPGSYRYEKPVVDWYNKAVQENFKDFPDVSEKLLVFSESLSI